jgi:AAHS family benzoate transporter-like MFS transporter
MQAIDVHKLADRLNPKWVLCGFCSASAVSLALLGYGVQPLWLVVALVGASTLGTQILAARIDGRRVQAGA